MRLLHNLLLAAALLPSGAFAHSTLADDRQNFIEQYATLAVQEMNRSRIPASVTLAQAILESNWGKGYTATEANNYFCIKCHNGWTGETYYLMDDEASESCFRVYESPEQSFTDHTEFLATNQRYRPLFQYTSTDYVNWAKGLKTQGYATDSSYDEKLIALIEAHGLYLYDYAVSTSQFDFLLTAEQEEYFDEAVGEEEEGDWKNYGADENDVEWETSEEEDSETIENQRVDEPGNVLDAPVYRLGNAAPQPSLQLQPQLEEPAPTGGGKIRPIVPLPEFNFERR